MITRQRPTQSYCGLTIILSKPSRFDLDAKRLITGRAGDWFSSCLTPFTRFNCDIRLLDEGASTEPILPNTKVILCLGVEALQTLKGTDKANIKTLRGSPFTIDYYKNHLFAKPIVVIASFSPQESFDRIDYDAKTKALDEIGEDKESEKDYQRTQRKNWRHWLYLDIKKALRILQNDGRLIEYPKVNYNIYPPIGEIIARLLNFSEGKLVIDIETDFIHNINCIGLCWTKANNLKELVELSRAGVSLDVWVIPIKRYNNTLAYDELWMMKFLQALHIAFTNNVVLTFNGGSFDLFVLAYKYKIPFPKNNYDLMVAYHRCAPETEKSLGHLISHVTDLPFHKDEGLHDPKTYEAEQKNFAYNGKDVSSTLFAYFGLQPVIKHLQAEESIKQANASIRAYLTKMYQGMRIDVPYMLNLYTDLEIKFLQMNRILSLVCDRPNMNARSQGKDGHVGKYLFETLLLPAPLKDYTAEPTLLKLYARYNVPSLRIVIAAREAGKLASSLKFKLWMDNRLTCNLKITGTETYRSASKTLLKFKDFKGWGTNDQNFSKKLRGIVIPDPGCLLGQTDQAGAEALIVAYLCADGNLRHLFKFGIKPHTYVAMHLAPKYWAERLGVPNIDEYLNTPIYKLTTLPYWKDLDSIIRKSDEHPDPKLRYYYIGKTCCHSLNYDASPSSFQLSTLVKSEGSLRLSIRECEIYHSLYRVKLFLELTGWHCAVQRELTERNRILRNLFGYPRKFNDSWGRELFKEAYAFIPQSTVGCITHIAYTKLQARIDEAKSGDLMEGVSLLQNGHDSILWQAPKEKTLDVARVIKKELEMDLTSPTGEKFKMGSGTSIGSRWCPKSKLEPEGLEELAKNF